VWRFIAPGAWPIAGLAIDFFQQLVGVEVANGRLLDDERRVRRVVDEFCHDESFVDAREARRN
jgi:hypothetical protein